MKLALVIEQREIADFGGLHGAIECGGEAGSEPKQ